MSPRPEYHRPYSKPEETPEAESARRAYNKEQRTGGDAAAMIARHGGRIIQDWLGYRFIQLAEGGVLFRRTLAPNGKDTEEYDNGRTDPQRPAKYAARDLKRGDRYARR
jgi:hypothetical protein